MRNKHYNIGEVVITKSHSYRILSVKCRTYTKSNTTAIKKYGRIHYDVMCMDCGQVFDVGTYTIQDGACLYCSGYKPIFGVNDIPTVAPWMVKYFQNGYEEAINYTITGAKKIIPKCPFCNKIHDKELYVYNLYRSHGFKCHCSDGISFPEKFMISLLDQLNIDYVHQAQTCNTTFDTKGKIYDFYIGNQSIIIETHGEQHYIDRYNFNTDYETVHKNDILKQQLAIQNGIQNYVIIDCRKSSIDWIKDSIMSSDLPILLSFSENDIDWFKCGEFATSNLAKTICEYYNSNDVNISELCHIFHIGKKGITNYLKRGAELGWCLYVPSTSVMRMKPFAIYKENSFICYGRSAKEFSRDSEKILGEHIDYNGIRKCLIGELHSFKGYTFEPILDLKLKREVLYNYASQ